MEMKSVMTPPLVLFPFDRGAAVPVSVCPAQGNKVFTTSLARSQQFSDLKNLYRSDLMTVSRLPFPQTLAFIRWCFSKNDFRQEVRYGLLIVFLSVNYSSLLFSLTL
ncbi:hypothetical protein OIU77_011571 [Salix suchowensis]|uniref:Uncharacterized protein n=1 Tax=Salix suchowensis TaxID=1278906 RepID=A0ABQ9A1G1_9ROSI|nr:hypothetical protein OIU77_011571 [Salix suchowensis]